MAHVTMGSYADVGLPMASAPIEHIPNAPQLLRARALALSRRALGFLLRLGPDGLCYASGCLELAHEYVRRAHQQDGGGIDFPPAESFGDDADDAQQRLEELLRRRQ